MKTPRWTNDPPVRPGFYWYRETRDRHEPTVLEIAVEEFGGNVDLFIREGPGRDQVNFIENYDGEWAGPIPLPVEERTPNIEHPTSNE